MYKLILVKKWNSKFIKINYLRKYRYFWRRNKIGMWI